ncbi:uncharacterized protein LOC127752861 [Oryza glaberrima]|uniref:F-box domain-containing protein n=1 Tax=Oryza glaberrima TaxID=4538 RepID=I1QTF3_ORYGL|nr:uncharacterized protein LOC127752861 [Oryza glaberrima]
MSSPPPPPPPCPAAACDDGWLSLSVSTVSGESNQKRLKRGGGGGGGGVGGGAVEDDGCPLHDEVLLLVFAECSLETDDLVRCAATCRRWRRLVAGDAEYICRRKPPSRRYVGALAVGFVQQRRQENSSSSSGAPPPPRFIPLPSYSSRFAGGGELDKVFDSGLLSNSRLIASRKGLLVLELRRSSRAAAVRLVVCNPMTGDMATLPILAGKDRPGHYACALITFDDHEGAPDRLGFVHDPAAFRLLLVYKRRNFTACRSYWSDTKTWDAEGKLSGAKIGGRRLGEMTGAVAVRGSVFWLLKNLLFVVRLGALKATTETFPSKWCSKLCFCYGSPVQNRQLAVTPDGRLCAVQVDRHVTSNNTVRINVISRHDGYGPPTWECDNARDVELNRVLPMANVRRVCLRGVCERSGVVFLAIGTDLYNQQPDLALYALDMDKKEARKVAAPPGHCRRLSSSFFGYEMDRVAYLASLSGGESIAS